MTRAKSSAKASPVRLFKNPDAWAAWLEKNCVKSAGIWLKLAKKNSGLRSVSYLEAVDIALCYGWIDAKSHSNDERTWLQRFVPRSEKSIWSKINCAKAARLIEEGRMRPSGLVAIERAKANGRWDGAYDSPSRSNIPEDLAAALAANARAKKFFETLDKANRYAILFRIQPAKKPETRANKIHQFISMLDRHEKIHS